MAAGTILALLAILLGIVALIPGAAGWPALPVSVVLLGICCLLKCERGPNA